MILRSIKLVHFGGVSETTFADLPERGVVDPPIPSDAAPHVVIDAVRFAFLGASDAPQSVISDGAGFAFVEVGFKVAADSAVSIFRGVDRRGVVQASLRESATSRVTGGEAEVRARLAELVGAPVDLWEYATWIERPSAATLGARGAGGLGAVVATVRRPTGPAARPDARAEHVEAPSTAEPIEARRARAEAAVDGLRRALRAASLRERIDADYAALRQFGVRLLREREEIDRVVGRLFADQEAMLVRSDRVASPGDRAPAVDARARLSAVDEEMAPLRGRLERLDDAVAAFETEVVRAARAARPRSPDGADAATADPAVERADEPRTRIARLGDAVYRASVERDAILAVGAGSVESAAEEVACAFVALADGAEDRQAARTALDRAGLPGRGAVDASRLLRDEDVCSRLADGLDAVLRARRDVAGPRATRDVPGGAASGADDEVARLLSDAAGTVAGGRLAFVQVGPRLELRLQRPDDSRPVGWDDLSVEVRGRIALALRLRLADEALDSAAAAPRCVILEDPTDAFADVAAIVDFVRSVAPRASQVFIPHRARAARPAPPRPA